MINCNYAQGNFTIDKVFGVNMNADKKISIDAILKSIEDDYL